LKPGDNINSTVLFKSSNTVETKQYNLKQTAQKNQPGGKQLIFGA
jgi:hypothetical protein